MNSSNNHKGKTIRGMQVQWKVGEGVAVDPVGGVKPCRCTDVWSGSGIKDSDKFIAVAKMS